MIIINDVVISPDEKEERVFALAQKRLHGMRARRMTVRKKAVDTRRGVRLVYSVAAELESEEAERRAAANDRRLVYKAASEGTEPRLERECLSPVIVGLGPCGLFAALTLARAGAKPIVVERGSNVDRRALLVEKFWAGGALESSNVQFGEGGAGTFSDGKLTTGINDPLCDSVLRDFVSFGAQEKILTAAKPHIGTDVLRKIVKNIRCEIERLGGRIMFDTLLTGVKLCGGKIRAAVTDKGEIPCDRLVLAIGHSARDTQRMLLESGCVIEKKPFSVGVRLEQRQSDVDAAMYGDFAGHPSLPPAEYKLSHREGGRGVYSFCMCPGGYVVASASEQGGVVTNGMSYSGRGGENANAAIVVSVLPQDLEDDVLSGARFQRRLEQAAFSAGGESYFAPCQRAVDYVDGRKGSLDCAVKPTYKPGVAACDLNGLFPQYINDMLKKGLRVFDGGRRGLSCISNGILTGVETRTSSPVRIVRDESMQSVSLRGIYPSGEGAGYAGGIMSAACDGIKTAFRIINDINSGLSLS